MTKRSKWLRDSTEQFGDESHHHSDYNDWRDKGPLTPDSPHDDDDEDWPWILAIQHKEQIKDMPNGVPAEIIPGKLYIGDCECVEEENKENLRKLGITAVLNVAESEGSSPANEKYLASEWKEGIKDGSFLYKAIIADDHKTYPLLDMHWKTAKEFLYQAIVSEDRPCLVHCVAGKNRSGLIVCAFYMVYTQTNLVPAVEHVRSLRGTEVLRNPGFQRQLVQLARREKLLEDKPVLVGFVRKILNTIAGQKLSQVLFGLLNVFRAEKGKAIASSPEVVEF